MLAPQARIHRLSRNSVPVDVSPRPYRVLSGRTAPDHLRAIYARAVDPHPSVVRSLRRADVYFFQRDRLFFAQWEVPIISWLDRPLSRSPWLGFFILALAVRDMPVGLHKHNLIFSFLLDARLPIYTSLAGKDFIVHYSFAYYISPVRLYQVAHTLAPFITLNGVLLGVYSLALFFATIVLSRGRMIALALLRYFALRADWMWQGCWLLVSSRRGSLDVVGYTPCSRQSRLVGHPTRRRASRRISIMPHSIFLER